MSLSGERERDRLSGSRLLGVALVVDDISKGCNLAFRYPAPPATRVSSFHKLSPPLLAKLFRPKNALCNQSFELVVDDLRFVSHPVLVSHRLPAAAPAASSASNGCSSSSTAAATAAPTEASSGSSQTNANGSTAAPPAPTSAGGKETTMFNVIFALEERSPQPGSSSSSATDPPTAPTMTQRSEEELLERRRRSARAFHTVAAQLANGLLHEELRAGFVSREVRELLHLRDELAQSEQHSSHAGGNGNAAMNAGATSGNSISMSMSAAVAAGATSGGSLTSNSGASIAGATGGNSHMHHHHRKDGETSSAVEVDPQTLIDASLRQSVLANDLQRVFHGLDEAGAVHVVLNRWVKLSLTLSDAVAVRMASLRPYHTLLLLADEEEILAALPADHARQLRTLVEAVNPLKSFQELALETGIPIHQLFRLAAHLIYWGFGRLVDAITLHNIYQVRADADIHSQSASAREFRRKFAPYELGEVLATISGARRIGEYMKTLTAAKKVEYVHMLIWLLQQRFVMQLHRYIYFMIPTDGDYAAESNSGLITASGANASSFGSPSLTAGASVRRRHRSSSGSLSTSLSNVGSLPVAHTPPVNPATIALTSPPPAPQDTELKDSSAGSRGRANSNAVIPTSQVMSVASQLMFTEQERAYLAKIAQPNGIFKLFKRLCVYFHGEHHMEEIMWRENISRGELRTVMSTYSDIVVWCLHE